MFTGLQITRLDAATEFLLLVGGKERDLVDLLEVRFEAAFGGNSDSPVGGGLRGADTPTIDSRGFGS